MGSKNRIAKHILPIILKDRKAEQCYVETMVGGGNLIDKVDGWRIGADINKYLIAVMSALSNGWEPPKSLTELEYKNIKDNKNEYPAELVGFVGFACSYGAKWFGGFCRGFDNKGNPRDYIMEAYRNVEKQKPKLKGIEFLNKSYKELEIPSNSLIYCDPPYKGTTQYKDGFDHNIFYEWCREKAEEGHTVFISEYNMPDDFECVWSKEINSSLTKNTGGKKGIEKLFTIKGDNMNTIRRTAKTELKKKKDFYQTNPYMVVSLINYLKQNKFRKSLKVLDPCEGEGVISNGLDTYFRNVNASDLYNSDNTDFLETTKKYDAIIMNPPYSAKYKFIDHARKHARYVFCLLPLNISNYNMFHREYEDIPEFVGKLQMAPKMFLDETAAFKAGGTAQYCWYIWDRRNKTNHSKTWYDDLRKYIK